MVMIKEFGESERAWLLHCEVSNGYIGALEVERVEVQIRLKRLQVWNIQRVCETGNPDGQCGTKSGTSIFDKVEHSQKSE
jgi:hypothetical protein